MCCLFGLIDSRNQFSAKEKSRILSVLATECEERGTDATGIAYCSHRHLSIYKRPVAAHRMRFRIPADSRVIMGHTRMTTQGDARRNRNNHPFLGYAENRPFALAHNGVLWNDGILRHAKHLPKTRIETDSYVAVQLIEQKNALDFSSLTYMAETVEGSFTFTVLDQRENLYFVKGDNPLCLYYYPHCGLYLYASTEAILNRALKRLHLPIGKPERVELKRRHPQAPPHWADGKGLFRRSESALPTEQLFAVSRAEKGRPAAAQSRAGISGHAERRCRLLRLRTKLY